MEIQISAEQKQLVQNYKSEALEHLSNVESANQQYKDIVAAASETTKLPKKIIGKYFKTCFQDKIEELTEEADVISFLDD